MNEIVVTRAPRLKSFRQSAIRPGTYFLQATYNPMNQYGLFEMGHHGVSRVNGPFELPYDIELRDIHVVPFESFEAMCKWVAGGRKLEDLQGGCKGELVPTNCLYAGQTGVVVASDFGRFNAGDVVMAVKGTFFDKSASGIVSLINGDCCPYTIGAITTGIENIMVWPLGPEDRITITAKP